MLDSQMPWYFKIRHRIESCSLWPNKALGVTWFVAARDVEFELSETSRAQRVQAGAMHVRVFLCA